MFKSVTKIKRLIIFIPFIFIVIFTVYSSLKNIKKFNREGLKRLEKIEKKISVNNLFLEMKKDDLIKRNQRVFSNSVDDKALKADLEKFIEILIKAKVLFEVEIEDVVSPYNHSNVAKFTLISFYETDKIILKRFINKIYHVKNIEDNPSGGIDFEIYNRSK